MLEFEEVMILVALDTAIIKESISNLERIFNEGDTNGGNPGSSKSAP